jgi:hypothetical protein
MILSPGTTSVRHLKEDAATELIHVDELAMQEITRL